MIIWASGFTWIPISEANKEFVLKEAEMLVTDYINKIEKNREESKKKTSNIEFKYKILKLYSITSTVLLIISLILNFIQ